MGDSALFVLKGIEDMLQTEVKFFSMIRKEGERMYICLGTRALYLIDFEPPFQEQFYYAWVQRVIIDSDNLLLFQIDFSEGRAPLILESFERDRLCDELAICWKADSMFRQWRCAPARAQKKIALLSHPPPFFSVLPQLDALPEEARPMRRGKAR